jgi:hypothetical protein
VEHVSFERQQAAALRILEGIEEGTMSAADSFALVEEADPTLIYLLFTWLRRRYADHPNADAVIGRLVAVVDRDPLVGRMMKEGQKDPVVAWFEEEHSYTSLRAREFVELIVDKLEG